MSNDQRQQPPGIYYSEDYLSALEKNAILAELDRLRPIWENRFSKSNPPPAGTEQRQLLRPVYWLGNWQFACLNYYHPPKGIEFRCVQAEEYPPHIQTQVERIQHFIRETYPARDIPRGWELNTCLVNYYGAKEINGKWEDMARVGEHKDFEPGPVASLSFGERALFQFVASEGKNSRSEVNTQMWLDDNSLQIFGGDKWKKRLFHRVQRVEDKNKSHFAKHIDGYRSRRINLTFRYVPREHIMPLARFPKHLIDDVRGYVTEIAKNSIHFQNVLTELKSQDL